MQLSNTVVKQPFHHNNERLIVEHPLGRADISLYGAQVLSFIPRHDERERLWLSENATLDGSQSIRGGVPLCWPWFGPHPHNQGPSHGYARNQYWQLVEIKETEALTTVTLKPTTTQGKGFDGQTTVLLTIKVGATLTITLTTRNVGDRPFTFNGALHSYLAVDDIKQTRLEGIEGEYLDKLDNGARKATPTPYLIDNETDRIHLSQTSHCEVYCQDHVTFIDQRGHDSVVVWNPWAEKSETMEDMTHDGYQHFVCIEAAVTQGLTLKAGDEHSLEQVIG